MASRRCSRVIPTASWFSARASCRASCPILASPSTATELDARVLALSGALAPILQQIPEVYFFGVGDMGIGYNLLALAIRMVSGAVYAIVLVKPIAHGLARAGVLRGTAVRKRCDCGCRGQGSGLNNPMGVLTFGLGLVTRRIAIHERKSDNGVARHPRHRRLA